MAYISISFPISSNRKPVALQVSGWLMLINYHHLCQLTTKHWWIQAWADQAATEQY